MPAEIPDALIESVGRAMCRQACNGQPCHDGGSDCCNWHLYSPIVSRALAAAIASLWVPDDPAFHDGKWRLVEVGPEATTTGLRQCLVARNNGRFGWDSSYVRGFSVTRVCLLPLPQGDEP